MSQAQDQRLLEAVMDSWDRNNTVLVNLAGAIPGAGWNHGQIKLAPKITGRPLAGREIGQLTWRVWMRKKKSERERI